MNRRADVIISNAKRNVEEGVLGVGDWVRKLKSRMLVRYKVNISSSSTKVQHATPMTSFMYLLCS